MKTNEIYNMDCMSFLHSVDGGQFDLTLTDIPYGEVNRSSNGLRNLDKEDADILTFNLQDFLKEIYEVTKSTIIIFCGKEQMSEIHNFFLKNRRKEKEQSGSLYGRKRILHL